MFPIVLHLPCKWQTYCTPMLHGCDRHLLCTALNGNTMLQHEIKAQQQVILRGQIHHMTVHYCCLGTQLQPNIAFAMCPQSGPIGQRH